MENQAPFPRQPALAAGVSLILMTVLGPLGLLPVEALRAAAPDVLAQEAAAGLPGFGWVVLAWAGVVVLDILVACALFNVFRDGAEGPARLAAWYRLAYAAVLGSLVTGLGGAAAMGRLGDAGLAPAIRAALDGFHEGFSLALMIFALHLIVLAGAMAMSRRAPRWLAVLVAIAGLGYLVDGISHVLGGTLNLAIFTFVGEPVLAIWLIWRALSQKQP